MLQLPRFTAEEIAFYLTDRLLRRPETSSSRKPPGWLKEKLGIGAASPGRGCCLDAFARERVVGEISLLVRERQDLIRQIAVDSRAVPESARVGDKGAALDDVMAAFDGMAGLEKVHLPALTGRIETGRYLGETLDAAKREAEGVSERVRELLGDPEAAAAYREELQKRIVLLRLARNVDSLRQLEEKCELAAMELVARRTGDNLPLTRADQETLQKYRTLRERTRARIDELMAREDVFFEVKRRNLLEYRRQLLTGGYVKTASVMAEIMRVLSHIQLGIPVFLRGHLGTGKTELALHVCRHYLGVEPEFISGSEEATKYDIYGRTQIGVMSETERMVELQRRMDQYRRINPGATDADLREAEKRYYETIVVKGQASSFFQEGPLIRAIREGKPLIIDEMDGIPHSIIMRMNHVLTRRPGDKGRVQEGGGEEITVQEGFCVLATGNVKSARYKREDLDAAFLSRWWSEDIRYPPQKETYEILTAALIDRRGDLQVKNPGDLDDLRRLTEVAEEIQRIFMGEHLDYLGEGADAARGVPAGLRKSVLSLRHLWNIVRPWKAHNFVKPLEHYVLEEFIRPAVAEDQVYLVQLFCRFRFFKDWGIDRFDLPGLTESKLLAFQGRTVVPG